MVVGIFSEFFDSILKNFVIVSCVFKCNQNIKKGNSPFDREKKREKHLNLCRIFVCRA